ncbi:hypothetical protein SAMN02910436_01104 [Ruminococcaceae bacterium P7]|nr:hypothetical protein SAMN02910436_01104 [Ruminococcaceae bacterium P7]
MEVLENSDNRRYSVIFSKTGNKSAILEEYQHGGMTMRLPLGELLFTVLESLGVILNNTEQPPCFDSFFSEREYNLTEFISDFSFDKNEAKRIALIVDYLERTSINTNSFNHYSLKNLFYSVLPREHSFYYLFDTADRYRVRRITSKLTLPFGNSTEYIYNKLSEGYASFSFITITEFHTMSELCLLSLFEILESGQFVLRCKECGRFYATKRKRFLCNRPAPFNEHNGCEKLKLAKYNKSYGQRESVKEYKNVYNRLQQRTTRKTNTLTDTQTFETFKREWTKLKLRFIDSPDLEQKKIEFLQSERWK